MRKFKEKIYSLVEPPEDDEKPDFYDVMMMIAIIVSILPLMLKSSNPFFNIADKVCTALFIADYLLRWFTADIKLGKGVVSFIAYPFTFWAIVDLLSILPGVTVLNKSFRLFKILRLIRMFRIFRVFKALRYSKNLEMIGKVISSERDSLVAVCWIAVGYIFVSALIVFNVEPQSFNDFFEAIYWATVSLTTVGYGDIYPVTTVGRIIAMISSLFGIAIVAMPAGIISAGFMDALHKEHDKKEE